jgi:hypothetical protein
VTYCNYKSSTSQDALWKIERRWKRHLTLSRQQYQLLEHYKLESAFIVLAAFCLGVIMGAFLISMSNRNKDEKEVK